MVEIKSPTVGLIGYLHDIEYSEKDSILIFQLPRQTNMIHEEYMSKAKEYLTKALPEGKQAIIIGCDINVYELAGADAIILKLKGLI
jgi:hypothetical protein